MALLALAAAGCSGDKSSADDGVSSSDALTSTEAAEGASWDGEEEDSFSPEEEAALSEEGDLSDSSGDDASGDVQTASSKRHACTRAAGFNHGTPMSICTTIIDGKAVEVSTAAAYTQMRDAARADGVGLIVVSGFRTMAKQRELYADYKNGTGNLAAPPGFSNHQSGHAVDLNTSAPGVRSWLVSHAATYGFRRTVPSENWHYEKW